MRPNRSINRSICVHFDWGFSTIPTQLKWEQSSRWGLYGFQTSGLEAQRMSAKARKKSEGVRSDLGRGRSQTNRPPGDKHSRWTNRRTDKSPSYLWNEAGYHTGQTAEAPEQQTPGALEQIHHYLCDRRSFLFWFWLRNEEASFWTSALTPHPARWNELTRECHRNQYNYDSYISNRKPHFCIA